MARTTPMVRNGLLVGRDEDRTTTIPVGDEAWQRWLDDDGTTTFRVDHPLGPFTARKERRSRGGAYWYAYRKLGGRLRKGYLGRAQDVTPKRLDSVAAQLGDARGKPAPPHPSPAASASLMAATLDPLLATKLTLPPLRTGQVRRPRLTASLAAGLRGPLTLLLAPAGWGKTTLLAEWCAQERGGDVPVAWLALDAGDNDLARFLRYLVAALQTARPEVGRAALASLRSPQPPPVEALLTLLLNDLTEQEVDTVLLLDDYHVVDAPTIHQAMAFLLDHLPARVHVGIATRSEPSLPLARLRALGQLTELRATDLRFTPDEADRFLRQTMGLPLAAGDVAALGEHTEGWIAGLQLAALSVQGRDPSDLVGILSASAGPPRHIADYLADEVFARQPDVVQRFLLRTSVLDRLCGALCEAVLGDDGEARAAGWGQATLARLEAANLFLVPLDDRRAWYRYHHLFAGFLRERLQRQRPDLLPELHRRASHWFAQHGPLAVAVDHALEARDDDLAARLIEQAMPVALWQRGELATLRGWLERLPPDVILARPRLGLDLAWVLLWSGQVGTIETYLAGVERATEDVAVGAQTSPGGAEALRGEVASIRAGLARQRGEQDAAIALGEQALTVLPADNRLVRGVTTGLLAQAHLMNGAFGAASDAFERAVDLGTAAGTIPLALTASGWLVHTQAQRGHLRPAQASYQKALDLAADHGLSALPAIGVAHVGMGAVLREWNRLDAAEDLVRRGVALCTDWGSLGEIALEGYITLAQVVQARGDLEGALALLRPAEAAGRAGQIAWAGARVAAAEVELRLRAAGGDAVAATRWATERDEVLRLARRGDYVGVLGSVALARLRLAQGRYDEAGRFAIRLLSAAEAHDWTRAVIQVLVLQALVFQGQGRTAESLVTLARAFALAEPEGYLRLFVDEGPPVIRLLRQAQRRGLAPAYVEALLAAGGEQPAASPTVPALVEPLSARELGVLRLLAAGLSAPEIAAQLVITAGTVRNHLKNVYGKLSVHGRLQAVERARALRLI